MPEPRTPFWRRKKVWMTAGPVVCLLAIYYVAIPGYVAGRLRAALAAHGEFRVAIGSVTANFKDAITLHHLTLADARGGRLLYARAVHITCAGNPLTDFTVPMTQVRLEGATLALSRASGRPWNWEIALDPAKRSGASGGGPAVPRQSGFFWPLLRLESCGITIETKDGGGDAMRLDVTDLRGEIRWQEDRYRLSDVAGACCGGALEIEGFLRPADAVHDLQCRLRDADVRGLFRNSPEKNKKISGAAEADFRVFRDAAGAPGRVQGQARLRDARLWELEFFETTMRVIRLGGIGATTFDEATVDFALAGGRLDIPESRFTSDAISFFGFGVIEESGELNMHLVPRFGEGATVTNLPVIGGILQQALDDVKSDAFQVDVTGTLFRPTTRVSPRGGFEEFSKSLSDKISDFLK